MSGDLLWDRKCRRALIGSNNIATHESRSIYVRREAIGIINGEK
ncbi:hypothetical protein SNOG_14307 [Parastagonospora nodorum SN15]|uniref:Uncharacterized protein n=2 Tax=Phaeosphaeria nodorum (strain SN15 / ATCC MYA-4574 / FGSC 10173) TaxID=321614 RepID=Q0U1D0_PHANO|nr:hypothetical protein SNOG_14307 [Parastagonospora nodorum SN15]EAT78178.1 hypothetical protein SNOG_14307 [Parastagonospora nodorum SN15]QRC99381.1 hypothetical protein JI435_143070 [Parastagonospora nodorum SN15]